MVICPGHCGATYQFDDAVKTKQMLMAHLQHCARGNASVEQLRGFARWLDREIFAETDNPFVVAERWQGEWEDREQLYSALIEAYIDDSIAASQEQAHMRTTLLQTVLKGRI